jgi:hypothetical protein
MVAMIDFVLSSAMIACPDMTVLNAAGGVFLAPIVPANRILQPDY